MCYLVVLKTRKNVSYNYGLRRRRRCRSSTWLGRRPRRCRGNVQVRGVVGVSQRPAHVDGRRRRPGLGGSEVAAAVDEAGEAVTQLDDGRAAAVHRHADGALDQHRSDAARLLLPQFQDGAGEQVPQTLVLEV